jgi:hypothetical protein
MPPTVTACKAGPHLLSRDERGREAQGIRPESQVGPDHDAGHKVLPVERGGKNIDERGNRQANDRDAPGRELQHYAWFQGRRDERSGRKRFAFGARNPKDPRLDVFFSLPEIRQELRERA